MTVPAQSAPTQYEAQVEAWVSSFLANNDSSFQDLICALPGVYPASVIEALDRLAVAGSVAQETLSLLKSEARGPASRVFRRGLLPPPHAFDYEWRFTSEGASRLLDKASHLAGGQDDGLLLGTSTVALEAILTRSSSKLVFIGEKNLVTDHLAALAIKKNSDVRICVASHVPPREAFRYVVLDPPWYPDFMREMTLYASCAVVRNGLVFVSAPPIGTRPGIAQDLDEYLAYTQSLGLELVEFEPRALGYETPLFESNSLLTQSINVSYPWRRGDLLVFKKNAFGRMSSQSLIVRRKEWSEVQVGRMRVFVKKGGCVDGCGEYLHSLVDGDILRSVSRRDPTRDQIVIWTSGNRIYGSSAPDLFFRLGDGVGEKYSTGNGAFEWGSMAARSCPEAAVRFIKWIAHREAEEEGVLT